LKLGSDNLSTQHLTSPHLTSPHLTSPHHATTDTNPELSDDEIKEVTRRIKQLADVKPQTMEDVDAILRSFHSEVTKNEMSHHVGIALGSGHTPNFFANP